MVYKNSIHFVRAGNQLIRKYQCADCDRQSTKLDTQCFPERQSNISYLHLVNTPHSTVRRRGRRESVDGVWHVVERMAKGLAKKSGAKRRNEIPLSSLENEKDEVRVNYCFAVQYPRCLTVSQHTRRWYLK